MIGVREYSEIVFKSIISHEYLPILVLVDFFKIFTGIALLYKVPLNRLFVKALLSQLIARYTGNLWLILLAYILAFQAQSGDHIDCFID